MRVIWILLSFLTFGGFGVAGSVRAEGNAAPIRLVLAFEGGSNRAVGLLLAEQARIALNRPVVIEEKFGASGRIAAVALKNAPPDGTTIAMFPMVVPLLAPLVFKDVQYDPVNDFAPISQIATYNFALAVPYDHPAQSVQEFIAWVKAYPSQAFYGVGAAGGLPHFLGMTFAKTTDTPLVAVAYKGAGPMTVDLIAGIIPAGISVVSDLTDLHRAKRIRIIAISSAKRLPALPEVPTFSEQGYPMVQASGWVGVYAPAKTPKAIIDQWSAAMVAAVRSPGLNKALVDFGLEPTGTTPEELGAILTSDIARWGPIVKASGFRAD